MGERRGTYRVLVRKPEEKRPHGRPTCKWKYNIKTDLKEIGWGIGTGLNWLRIWTRGGIL
jgi:hypothetical protein